MRQNEMSKKTTDPLFHRRRFLGYAGFALATGALAAAFAGERPPGAATVPVGRGSATAGLALAWG